VTRGAPGKVPQSSSNSTRHAWEAKLTYNPIMRTPVTLLWTAGVAAFAIASSGCNPAAKKVGEHFLDALQRDDWATAFADLHPEARIDTPTAEALRARIEQGDMKLVSWYGNCGSGGSLSRIGYNVTTSTRKTSGPRVRPIIIGIRPEYRGKCNGPMLVELKVDPSLPDQAWRVRSFKYN